MRPESQPLAQQNPSRPLLTIAKVRHQLSLRRPWPSKSSHANGPVSVNDSGQVLEDSNYTYVNDLNDNRISRVHKTTGVKNEYVFDARNQLMGFRTVENAITVRAVWYLYDGLDRRVGKVLDFWTGKGRIDLPYKNWSI